MSRDRLFVLALALALLFGLGWGMSGRTNFSNPVALAAPDTIDCVKGKNGIKQKGTGCSGRVTLQLVAGGTITGTTGFALRANNIGGTAALYAQEGSGSEDFFSPAAIIANAQHGSGIFAVTDDGSAVYGFAEGPDAFGVGVYGQSNSPNGYGVIAETFGDSFALWARNNTKQDRNKGGMVKAMAHFAGSATSPDRCFNSQQTGALISSGGCGITRSGSGGNYVVDFNFQVNDRFISVLPEDNNDEVVSPVVSFASLPSDQVRVKTLTISGGNYAFIDRAFFVIVY